jgi:hypothetical protein
LASVARRHDVRKAVEGDLVGIDLPGISFIVEIV